MFDTACHCGKVKLKARQVPDSVTCCNCSICHRLGALWAYYNADEVIVTTTDGPPDSYAWGEKTIVYHRCGDCGCTTHYTATDSDGVPMIAVNCRMATIEQMKAVPVRQFDGLDSWQYLDEQAQ